jgi:hypothetical protein
MVRHLSFPSHQNLEGLGGARNWNLGATRGVKSAFLTMAHNSQVHRRFPDWINVLLVFLTKPTKWFSRSASTGKVPSHHSSGSGSGSSSGGYVDGRSSMTLLGSSPSGNIGSGNDRRGGGKDGSRKPKISRPTDPRPIRDAGVYGASPGSRWVVFIFFLSLFHSFSSLFILYIHLLTIPPVPFPPARS